jgi:hypothetical protein
MNRKTCIVTDSWAAVDMMLLPNNEPWKYCIPLEHMIGRIVYTINDYTYLEFYPEDNTQVIMSCTMWSVLPHSAFRHYNMEEVGVEVEGKSTFVRPDGGVPDYMAS